MSGRNVASGIKSPEQHSATISPHELASLVLGLAPLQTADELAQLTRAMKVYPTGTLDARSVFTLSSPSHCAAMLIESAHSASSRPARLHYLLRLSTTRTAIRSCSSLLSSDALLVATLVLAISVEVSACADEFA